MTASAGVRRWNLFVDESGKFSDKGDVVVVAGVLMGGGQPLSDSGLLRGALRKALPTFPWPLHAAHLNLPVTLALAQHARTVTLPAHPPDGLAASQGLTALLEQAVKALNSQASGKVAEAVGRLKEGAWPEYDTLKTLDDTLRRGSPSLHDSLRNLMRQAVAVVSGLLEETVSRAAGEMVLGLVTGGESCAGDAAPPAATTPLAVDSGRYGALLECSMERVCELLARAGRHEVGVQVLNRTVLDPVVNRPAQLHVRHLSDLVTRLNQRFRDRVRLVVHAVSPFSDDAHAALVLADFAANRARRGLSMRDRPLSRVEEAVQRATGLPVRSGDPALSHLAATGWARAHIQAVRSRVTGTAVPAAPGVSRWAREQALEWDRVGSPCA